MATRTKPTTTPEAAQSYSTPALEKGLDILELLAKQPAGLTKSEIARALDRTVSEIFRMLVCLEQRGYIAQLAGDRYSLTLKLFKMVQEHPPTERLIADAIPLMHHLAGDTMQSCHLGVLEGGHVVILAQVNAPANVGFYVKLGSTVGLMEAGSGYVILAHMSEQQRARILEEWSRENKGQPPRDLNTHLAHIRRKGYEKHASYLVRGIVNISFPIFDDRGAPVAALTVPYINYAHQAIREAEVVRLTRATALEISAALGAADSR